jgi:hypothetical protein
MIDRFDSSGRDAEEYAIGGHSEENFGGHDY